MTILVSSWESKIMIIKKYAKPLKHLHCVQDIMRF